jgi:hypothetical protein
MKTIVLCNVAVMILVGSLLSQANQPEPFGFKDAKLGMSLQDFQAQHRIPGEWEIRGVAGKGTVVGSDDSSWEPPAGKHWEWVPEMECKETVKGIATCIGRHHGVYQGSGYTDTIASLPAHVSVYFADGRLAVISLAVETQQNTGDPIWQGLIAKFGAPQVNDVHRFVVPNCTTFFREAQTPLAALSKAGKLWCTNPHLPRTCIPIDQLCAMPTVNKQTCPPKHGEPVLSCEPQEYRPPSRTLRWDNGVSVMTFNNNGCTKNFFPYGDIKDILEGGYCKSTDITGDIFVWYVHKELSRLLFVRRKEGIDAANKKARSDF